MGKMHEWITTGERPVPSLYISPFAKSASGSSDDDDDLDDDDEDDDEDDEDDEDDDPDAEKDEAELRAELKTIRASLAKANGQSAKRRKALREREAAHAAEIARVRKAKAAGKAKADEDDDLDEKLAAAKREGETAGVTRAKRSEAKVALVAAGVSAERVARAVGLLNLDDLDLDDDGLDGIDEAIDDLKKAWPELFARRRTRRESVVERGDRDGHGTKSTKKKMTASELQAARLVGAGR